MVRAASGLPARRHEVLEEIYHLCRYFIFIFGEVDIEASDEFARHKRIVYIFHIEISNVFLRLFRQTEKHETINCRRDAIRKDKTREADS